MLDKFIKITYGAMCAGCALFFGAAAHNEWARGRAHRKFMAQLAAEREAKANQTWLQKCGLQKPAPIPVKKTGFQKLCFWK